MISLEWLNTVEKQCLDQLRLGKGNGNQLIYMQVNELQALLKLARQSLKDSFKFAPSSLSYVIIPEANPKPTTLALERAKTAETSSETKLQYVNEVVELDTAPRQIAPWWSK